MPLPEIKKVKKFKVTQMEVENNLRVGERERWLKNIWTTNFVMSTPSPSNYNESRYKSVKCKPLNQHYVNEFNQLQTSSPFNP